MLEVKAIVRADRLQNVLHAVRDIAGVGGVTVSKVEGFGRQRHVSGPAGEFGQVVMAKVETVIPRDALAAVTTAITTAAATGRPGDGKIFILPVETVIDIRAAHPGSEP